MTFNRLHVQRTSLEPVCTVETVLVAVAHIICRGNHHAILVAGINLHIKKGGSFAAHDFLWQVVASRRPLAVRRTKMSSQDLGPIGCCCGLWQKSASGVRVVVGLEALGRRADDLVAGSVASRASSRNGVRFSVLNSIVAAIDNQTKSQSGIHCDIGTSCLSHQGLDVNHNHQPDLLWKILRSVIGADCNDTVVKIKASAVAHFPNPKTEAIFDEPEVVDLEANLIADIGHLVDKGSSINSSSTCLVHISQTGPPWRVRWVWHSKKHKLICHVVSFVTLNLAGALAPCDTGIELAFLPRQASDWTPKLVGRAFSTENRYTWLQFLPLNSIRRITNSKEAAVRKRQRAKDVPDRLRRGARYHRIFGPIEGESHVSLNCLTRLQRRSHVIRYKLCSDVLLGHSQAGQCMNYEAIVLNASSNVHIGTALRLHLYVGAVHRKHFKRNLYSRGTPGICSLGIACSCSANFKRKTGEHQECSACRRLAGSAAYSF
mmetsp:Transcript_75031/g.175981  ORF Transcript_75031/g.175981 Transcript_75031/m.175981 type:complete len:489 (-) Transcript_75031:161-1627(-)